MTNFVQHIVSKLDRGPKVLLNHPDKIKSTFQAPGLDKYTVLIFRLVVKDNNGLTDSDTVGVKF